MEFNISNYLNGVCSYISRTGHYSWMKANVITHYTLIKRGILLFKLRIQVVINTNYNLSI